MARLVTIFAFLTCFLDHYYSGAQENQKDYIELTKRKPENPAELLAFCGYVPCQPPAVEMMILVIPKKFNPNTDADPCPIRVDCINRDICMDWSAAVCRYFANQTADAYLCSCDPLRPHSNTNFRCNYSEDRIGYCDEWKI